MATSGPWFWEALWKTAALCGDAPFCPHSRRDQCGEVVPHRRWDAHVELDEDLKDPWHPTHPQASRPSLPKELSRQEPPLEELTQQPASEGWLQSTLNEVEDADAASIAATTRPQKPSDETPRGDRSFDTKARLSPVHETDAENELEGFIQDSESDTTENVAWTWDDDCYTGGAGAAEVQAAMISEAESNGVLEREGTGEKASDKYADSDFLQASKLAGSEEDGALSAADLAAGLPRVVEVVQNQGLHALPVTSPPQVVAETPQEEERIPTFGHSVEEEELPSPVSEIAGDRASAYNSEGRSQASEHSALTSALTASPGQGGAESRLDGDDRESDEEEVALGSPPPSQARSMARATPLTWTLESQDTRETPQPVPAMARSSLAAAARGQFTQSSPDAAGAVPIAVEVIEAPRPSAAHCMTPRGPHPFADAQAAPLRGMDRRQAQLLHTIKASDGAVQRGRSPVRKSHRTNATMVPALQPGKSEPLAWLAKKSTAGAVRLRGIRTSRVIRAGLLRMDEALRASRPCSAADLQVAAGVASELLDMAQQCEQATFEASTDPQTELSCFDDMSVNQLLLIRASTFDVFESVAASGSSLGAERASAALERMDASLAQKLPEFILQGSRALPENSSSAVGVQVQLTIGVAELVARGYGQKNACAGQQFQIPERWLLEIGPEVAVLDTRRITLEALATLDEVASRCGSEPVAIARQLSEEVGMLDWEIFVASPVEGDLEAVLSRARRVEPTQVWQESFRQNY